MTVFVRLEAIRGTNFGGIVISDGIGILGSGISYFRGVPFLFTSQIKRRIRTGRCRVAPNHRAFLFWHEGIVSVQGHITDRFQGRIYWNKVFKTLRESGKV